MLKTLLIIGLLLVNRQNDKELYLSSCLIFFEENPALFIYTKSGHSNVKIEDNALSKRF